MISGVLLLREITEQSYGTALLLAVIIPLSDENIEFVLYDFELKRWIQ